MIVVFLYDSTADMSATDAEKLECVLAELLVDVLPDARFAASTDLSLLSTNEQSITLLGVCATGTAQHLTLTQCMPDGGDLAGARSCEIRETADSLCVNKACFEQLFVTTTASAPQSYAGPVVCRRLPYSSMRT